MGFFLNNEELSKFITHNKNIFNKKKSSNTIFLVEFNGWQGVQIANSYLVNSLPFIKNYKVVAFESYRLLQKKKFILIEKLKWKIGSLFGINNFGIYKSFGTDDFIYEKKKLSTFFKSQTITKNFFLKNPTKIQLENFTLNGVWLGDLIYDSYLKKFNLYTIDLAKDEFRSFFRSCIENFFFWEDFFDKNDVGGISVSHGCYTHAIPLRIAVKNNIPAYVCSHHRLFRIDKKKYSLEKKTSGVEIQNIYFKKYFNKFSNSQKRKNCKKGQLFLNDLLNEKIKYFYFSKKNKKKLVQKKILRKNKLIKIIIFAHSFYDAPHVRGLNLFPDFFEWLNFLGKISKQTNYDWYIKPHPNYEENDVIKKFVKKFPNIKIVDVNLNNKNLAKNEFKFALTMYGSCASELPLLGIKVINASINNPHVKYNFSISPKNLNQYKKVILNLKKIKPQISDKKELFQYHYMNQFFFNNTYLFEELDKYHSTINGRPIMYTNKVFKKWIKNFSKEKHQKIIKNIINFYNNNDYLLSKKNTINF